MAAEADPYHRLGADIISRILGRSMQEKLGQPVVIENRPGAGGTIGNEAVARADKRHGMAFSHLVAHRRTDFDPVSLVATASLMIAARPDFPASTVKDLVAAAEPIEWEMSDGSARAP